MSSPFLQPSAGPPAEDPGNGTDEHLRELRGLLIGPELRDLKAIQQRLDDPQIRSEDLSKSIAEAIGLRAKRDRKLQTALQPIVEEALKISVERDPAMLATALFPIIGEAVRKAVAHALQGMFDSLNQVLDRSFSLESWKWRLEGWRTGKSFGEIALTHSLNYRVEQIFLIHRETGLLVAQAAFSGSVVQDAEMVSGMLTAIQDFVRDSFTASKADNLEKFEVGGYKVWVEHGPLALTAAVVSGQPPPELQQVFERELEAIHRDFGKALQEFSGDGAALAGAEVNLRRCLLGGKVAAVKKSNRAVLLVGGLLLLLVCVLVGLRIRNTRRWNGYIERLKTQPGLVVIGSERRWLGYEVHGLRDPLATDPLALLAGTGVPAKKVQQQWEPYLSLDPSFAGRRRVLQEKEALEKQILRFDLNSAKLPVSQFAGLETVEDELNTLRHAADAEHGQVVVEVSGHTDRRGQESHNMELSQSRAETVVRALVERGIPRAMLKTAGLAASTPEHTGLETYPEELDRRVTFRVVAAEPGAKGEATP